MPATDPADCRKIAAALHPSTPFTHLTCVDVTGSTNADLAAAARTGAPHGTVLICEHQESGRGRFERSWVQTPGACIAMSLLLHTDVPLERWGWLPLLTGLAVHEGLTFHLDATDTAALPILKWPNDILVGPPRPGKIVGILAERVQTPGGPAAVIGIGINVWLDETELPVPTASSLKLSGLTTPDKSDLIAAILNAFAALYQQWVQGVDLRPRYRECCGTIGSLVRGQLDEQRGLGTAITGVATDIDESGSLIVVADDGEMHCLSAGDVIHLRPAAV